MPPLWQDMHVQPLETATREISSGRAKSEQVHPDTSPVADHFLSRWLILGCLPREEQGGDVTRYITFSWLGVNSYA